MQTGTPGSQPGGSVRRSLRQHPQTRARQGDVPHRPSGLPSSTSTLNYPPNRKPPHPGLPPGRLAFSRRGFLGRLAFAVAAAIHLPGGPGSLPATAAAQPDTYVVRPGDTLSGIAVQHGVPLSRLRTLNGITTDHIRPGQRLRLRAESEYPLLASVRSRIAVGNLHRTRWKHIILHHSATAGGNAEIFDRFHRERRRMENGLAYHFIIGNGTDSTDGQIEVGPRWTRQLNGGHVRSLALNDNSVGICLVGDFERTRPTDKQVAASLELVGYLQRTLLAGTPRVLVHRELKGEHTLCPGRHFPTGRFRRFRA